MAVWKLWLHTAWYHEVLHVVWGGPTKYPAGLPRALAEAATYGKFKRSNAHTGATQVKPIAAAKAAPPSKASPVTKAATPAPAPANVTSKATVPAVDPKTCAQNALLELNKAKEILADKEKKAQLALAAEAESAVEATSLAATAAKSEEMSTLQSMLKWERGYLAALAGETGVAVDERREQHESQFRL